MSLPSTFGKPTGFFAAAAALVVSSLWFAACATGSRSEDLWQPGDGNIDDPDASVGDGGGPKGFGETCTLPIECESKQCTPMSQGAGAEKVCSEPCAPGKACPKGANCAFVAGLGYQCVPDRDSICGACVSDSSCKAAGEKCVESPFGDRYCARDCSWDGVCPANYKCVDFDAVDDPDDEDDLDDPDAGADPDPDDAGAPDASVTDAGGDAGDPGAGSGTKKGNKYCVPVNKAGEEQSCECSPKRKGVSRNCTRSSTHGTCAGTQSCDGTAWSSCSAKAPEAEICDGIDNDCDGEIDNAPTEQLCPPVHQGAQICEAGKCKLTGCEAGWTNFPPGPVSEGCQCQIVHGADSNTCATAIPMGTASDSGTGLEISGTLAGFGIEKWFRFETTDSLASITGTGSSKFHVSIRIDEPSPNNEFFFEVIRGNNCGGEKFTGLQAYDWCADFTGSRDGQTVGQAACQGPAPPSGAPDHCGRGSGSSYYVRVYRNPDLATDAYTCRTFKLSVQASGSRGDFDCNEGNVCSASP